ncbi:MAG: PEP-CTERM sorting domain-containing protein [Verrucomicrobiaceae bacterium]
MRLQSLLLIGIVSFISLASTGSASISFTGNFSSNLKKSDGTTNAEVGNRFLIIVDNGGDGFGALTNNSIAAGTGFTAGNTFGDANDIILESDFLGALTGRAAATVVNNDAWNSLYGGKNFGLVWFDTATSGTSSLSNGDKYGFTRDTAWVMQSADGTYNFTTAPTGSDYRQMGGAGFLPGGTTLAVGVPEPSRMLLMAMGVIGLGLRRRR